MRRVLLLLALVLAVPAVAAETAGGDPMRDSLRHGAAPWYDAKADGWRRVEVPKEEPRDDPEAHAGPGGNVLVGLFSAVMYLLVGAAVALLLWFVARTWLAKAPAEPDAAARAPTVNLSALPFQLAVRQHGDPEAALAAALAAGDWALAAMWIYAIQLLRLDRSGVIRLVPGKTNRGYLREAREAPAAVREALAASVAAFERSYFGHLPLGEAALRDLERRHRGFIAALDASDALAGARA